MGKKVNYSALYDSVLRDDAKSPQSLDQLREKAEDRFGSLLNRQLTQRDDVGQVLSLLVKLGNAADGDKPSFGDTMKILNLMAEELGTLRDMPPERAEMLVESLRKRLLELIEEAKDK